MYTISRIRLRDRTGQHNFIFIDCLGAANVRHWSLTKFKSSAGWRIKQQIYSKLFFRTKNQDTIMHFNVISKTHIAVFLRESTVQYYVFASLLSLPAEIWNFVKLTSNSFTFISGLLCRLPMFFIGSYRSQFL